MYFACYKNKQNLRDDGSKVAVHSWNDPIIYHVFIQNVEIIWNLHILVAVRLN